MLRKQRGTGEDEVRTLAEDLLKAVAQRKWLKGTWSVEEVQPRFKGSHVKLGLAVELLERIGQVKREALSASCATRSSVLVIGYTK